ERRPRFLGSERERGWHVQYDAFREGESLLRDPASLRPWDPTLARLDLVLRHRGVEELEDSLAVERRALSETRTQLAEAETRLLGLDHDLQARTMEIQRLGDDLRRQAAETAALQHELETEQQEGARLRGHLDVQAARSLSLQKEVEGQRCEIDRLQAALDTGRAEAAALQKEVESQRREIDRLQGALDRGRAEAAALQREVGAREGELKRFQGEVGRLRCQLADVYASRSWRWTTPLRLTLRCLRGY